MTSQAAVAGLNRSDVRQPGLTRERAGRELRYRNSTGAEVTDPETLARIRALALPPAWTGIWISPDPLGHIQATGVDSRGRTQYRYHELWRQQRDDQKFQHMLRFAAALPDLRDSTVHDLQRRPLDRGRVAAAAVRLIDLGLFRLGGERYAELDHHYGATTLEKSHVSVRRDGLHFDYVAKEGKHRLITVADDAVLPTVRALARSDNGLSGLFCFRDRRDEWHPLHSHDVSAYIADNSRGHFTAKEFRTWNATLLMALLLVAAGPPASEQAAKTTIRNSVRGVADWLGDTPAVARASYIDPRIVGHYESGSLATIPLLPARLPVDRAVEQALAALLAATPVTPRGDHAALTSFAAKNASN